MQLHQISKNKSSRVSRRVGRGGKRGTFSGRGVKGQKSRSGRKLRPEWRDVLKSLPKMRGYKFKSLQKRTIVLNLEQLDRVFKEGEIVTAEALVKKGLVSKSQSRLLKIKILGQGKISKKLNFKGVIFSGSAKDAIIKVGGAIN